MKIKEVESRTDLFYEVLDVLSHCKKVIVHDSATSQEEKNSDIAEIEHGIKGLRQRWREAE